jgi:hypothetical protein
VRTHGAGLAAIAHQERVTPVELREEPAHEACRRGMRTEPVVHPLSLAQPLDEPRFAEDLQVS